MKLPIGLEVYRSTANEIVSWMLKWLHQDDFDRKVEEYRRSQRTRCHYYTPDTFMLGDMWGDKRELDLLQHLMALGFVEGRERLDGRIEYRAVKESKE